MTLGPRHRDVEKATLLHDRLGCLRLCVGQPAFHAAGDDDSAPLQALGRVDGCEGDAAGDGCVLGGGAAVQFGGQAREVASLGTVG